MQYPPQIEIVPLAKPPHATVRVPGSKSITNRALVLAALTADDTRIEGALQSEDTEVMVDSLRRLGFQVDADWDASCIRVRHDPSQPIIPTTQAELFVANSGTSMRFLAAMVALGNGRYRIDGVPRMRERPIADLLDALNQLGVKAISEFGNGCPPVVIESAGLAGGTVRIKGDTSSQFLSALLMASSMARSDVTIVVDGPLVSAPYVQMTVAMMGAFRLSVYTARQGQFEVHAPRTRKSQWFYAVEPDASAASYFFAAAAITGGRVSVEGLKPSGLQGDVRFAPLLERMGCKVSVTSCRQDDASIQHFHSITVHGSALHGIDVDMNDISDTVMTLAAVACFADGPTTIRNVAHIRHKETDRLAALATELRRIGALVEEHTDGLTITPAPLHGAVVQTYDDHRMAMSLALIGLRVPGIVIDNPGCVAKTYPQFFEDLERLRQ